MKVDRGFEVLFVPESSRRVLHPPSFGVDRFTGFTLPPQNVSLSELPNCFNSGKGNGDEERKTRALHAGIQAGVHTIRELRKCQLRAKLPFVSPQAVPGAAFLRHAGASRVIRSRGSVRTPYTGC
jgi:hypothetical protein